MKTFIATFAIVFSLLSISPSVRGQEAPLDQQLARRIDSIFSPYARTDAPGCAVSVMKAGKILYANGYGMADVAQGIPLRSTTPTNVASTSKQFTALAILLLDREGKLRLDDEVRRYLPEFPDFGHPITLRMLLNHTSGLRELTNLFYLAGWRNSDVQSKDDVLMMIKRQRDLNHLPGAEFAYNSSGYILLAIVIERVSGVSFRRFIIDRIFTPLGMTRSEVQEEINQVIPHRATGYWGHDPAALRTARPPFSFAGPNGVVTSVEDLARWDENFYSQRVGTKAMLDQMSTAGRLAGHSEFGYGMGLFVGTHRGFAMVSHAGSDYGYKADFIRFPSEQITVAVLCNAFDIAPTPLALQVADLYLPPKEKPPVTSAMPPLPHDTVTENSAAFAGLYWNDARGEGPRFVYQNGQLKIDGGGEGLFVLRPLGNNVFRLMEAPRRYVFTFMRRAGSLVLSVDHEGSPVREYRRVVDAKPSAATLRSLAGKYYSQEVHGTWTFVARGDSLVLERPWTEPTKLSAVFGKIFDSHQGFTLEFRRTRSGESLVEVSTERARRVKFIRTKK